MKCNYSKKFVRKRIKLFADDDESTSNKIVDNLMPVAGLAALGGIGYAGYKGLTGIGKGIKNGANFASGFWTNKKAGMNSADAFRNAKTTGQEGLIQNFLDRKEINKQQQAAAKAANANNTANQTGGIGETVKKAVTTPTEEMQQTINAAEERAKQQLSGNNTTTGGTGGNTGGQKTEVNSEAEKILDKAKENNTSTGGTGGTGGNTGQQTATEMAEKSKQHSQFKPKMTAEQIEAAKAAGAEKRLAREVARERNVDTLEERKKRLESAKQTLVENPEVGANGRANRFLVGQAKETFDPKIIRRVHNNYVQQKQHEAAVVRKQQAQQERAANRQAAYKQNVKLKNSEESKQIRAQRKAAAKENIDPLAAKAKLIQENPEKFNKARQTASKKNTKLINTKDLSTLSEDQANSVTRFRDARQRAEQNQKQQQQLAARQQAQKQAQQQKQQQAADRQQSRINRRQRTEQRGQQITQFRQKRNEYLDNPAVQQSPEAMRDVYQGKFRKSAGIVKNQQDIENRRQRSRNYIHVYSPEQLEKRSGRSGNRNFDSLAPENKVPTVMTQESRRRLERLRDMSDNRLYLSGLNNKTANLNYNVNELQNPRQRVTEPSFVPYTAREKKNIFRASRTDISTPTGPVVAQSKVKFQPGGLKMANATGSSNNTAVNSATQQKPTVQQNNSNKVAEKPVTSSNAQVNAPQTQAKPQQTATEMAEKSKQHSQFKPKTQAVTGEGGGKGDQNAKDTSSNVGKIVENTEVANVQRNPEVQNSVKDSNKVAEKPVTSSNAQVNTPQTQDKPQQTATEMAEKSKQHSQFKPKVKWTAAQINEARKAEYERHPEKKDRVKNRYNYIDRISKRAGDYARKTDINDPKVKKMMLENSYGDVRSFYRENIANPSKLTILKNNLTGVNKALTRNTYDSLGNIISTRKVIPDIGKFLYPDQSAFRSR